MSLIKGAKRVLSDGHSIPNFGLGVYQAPDGSECYNAVLAALHNGYRHIDTAAIYRNEDSVGRAIKDSGVPREDIYVTTKFWSPSGHGVSQVEAGIKKSLSLLGLDYVDLYLVHSPADVKNRDDTWRGMEQIKDAGLARSIGVSNYGVAHLKHLLSFAKHPPVINQIELSPYRNCEDIVKLCTEHNIVIESYSPLTKGVKLQDPNLVALSKKYNKSPAQVLIRYAIDRDWVVIPKSVTTARIIENADVFDFALSGEDVAKMRGWECNLVTGWDPTIAP